MAVLTVVVAALPLVGASPAMAALSGPGLAPQGGTATQLTPVHPLRGEEGRTGGRLVEWSGLSAASYSHLYWGPWGNLGTNGPTPQIGAGATSPDDVSTLTLASGVGTNAARYTGTVKIRIAAGGGWTNQTLQARMTLTTTTASGDPINWIDASTVGLSTAVSPIVIPVTADSFRFHYLFEVSNNGGASWTPLLNYYDAAQTDPSRQTLMSLRAGFFWNRAPVTVSSSLETEEDTDLSITLLANDADNNPLSWALTSLPANGTLSGTAPNLIYTPNLNFNGTDSFTFSVNDGLASSATDGVVDITVAAINDAPVADPQSLTTDEDIPLAITLTGSDQEGDPLSFSVVGNPANGTLTGSGANLIYTPNLNFNGSDSFRFVSNDGQFDSAPATVGITINGVNDAPQPLDDFASTPQYTPVTVNVIANDTDPESDALTVTAVTVPQKGTVDLNGDGTITYRPIHTFKGSDSFTYTVDDGNGGSATATVTITEEGCGEDGLDLLHDTPASGVASGIIDKDVEPLIGSFDEGLAATLHDFNCTTVVPAEDGIDDALGGAPEPPEAPEVPDLPPPPEPGASAASRHAR